MSIYRCYKCSCAIAALVISLIVGVITSFLQITAAITITPVFLWALFGIAVLFLVTLVLSSSQRSGDCPDQCVILDFVLAGILGTILFALVLLAVGITATSAISAILAGLLLFSFSLALTAQACWIRCSLRCTE